LTLGILSLVLCGFFTGLPAWIMGTTDLREMAAGRMDNSGESLTRVGQILGIVSTALSIIGACVWVMALGAMGGLR
jgi:hypothetical protein